MLAYLTGTVIGILTFIVAYRIRKHYIRRCSCGSLLYLRFHKLKKIGSGEYESYTFRHCFHCGSFVEVKSQDKHLSGVRLLWRYLHPWQFSNVNDCLRRSGILVPAPRLFNAHLTMQKHR